MLAVPMTVSDLMRLEVPGTPRANAEGVPASSAAAKNYGIYRLELIAIAKHDTPVVFNQPNHKHPSNAEIVRALTNFETKAVEELRAGKDVTFEASSDGTRAMLREQFVQPKTACTATSNIKSVIYWAR